jgi:hypothetical protein
MGGNVGSDAGYVGFHSTQVIAVGIVFNATP